MAGDRRTQPSFCDLWTDGHVCPTTIQGYTTYSRRKIELKPLEYHNCSTSIIDKYYNCLQPQGKVQLAAHLLRVHIGYGNI